MLYMKIADCIYRKDICSSHKMVLQCYIQHMILKSLRFMSMHTAKNHQTTLWQILICYCYLNTHFHKHGGLNRNIQTLAEDKLVHIYSYSYTHIQCSSIHRYGMCLMTNFSDHNILLPFYSSLHTIMIWRFLWRITATDKRLGGV